MELEKVTEQKSMGTSLFIGSFEEVNEYLPKHKDLYVKDFDVVVPRTDVKIVAHLSQKTSILNDLLSQKIEYLNSVPLYVTEKKDNDTVSIPAVVRAFSIRQEIKLMVLYNTFRYAIPAKSEDKIDSMAKDPQVQTEIKKIEQEEHPVEQPKTEEPNQEQEPAKPDEQKPEESKPVDASKPESITKVMDELMHGGQHTSASGYYDQGKKKRK